MTTCKHGQQQRACELCEKDAEIASLRAELDALRKQEPVEWKVESGMGTTRRFSTYEATYAHRQEGWSVTPLYAAPFMPQVPDGYRLQPLSEYDAMMSAPLDADNAELKAVWKWCRQTATDYGNGNARQRAAATAYLAAAHHIKSKYFRGCSDRSMIAASQKEDKP